MMPTFQDSLKSTVTCVSAVNFLSNLQALANQILNGACLVLEYYAHNFSFQFFLCCVAWAPNMESQAKSKNMIMEFHMKASIIYILFIPQQLLSNFC